MVIGPAIHCRPVPVRRCRMPSSPAGKISRWAPMNSRHCRPSAMFKCPMPPRYSFWHWVAAQRCFWCAEDGWQSDRCSVVRGTQCDCWNTRSHAGGTPALWADPTQCGGWRHLVRQRERGQRTRRGRRCNRSHGGSGMNIGELAVSLHFAFQLFGFHRSNRSGRPGFNIHPADCNIHDKHQNQQCQYQAYNRCAITQTIHAARLIKPVRE